MKSILLILITGILMTSCSTKLYDHKIVKKEPEPVMASLESNNSILINEILATIDTIPIDTTENPSTGSRTNFWKKKAMERKQNRKNRKEERVLQPKGKEYWALKKLERKQRNEARKNGEETPYQKSIQQEDNTDKKMLKVFAGGLIIFAIAIILGVVLLMYLISCFIGGLTGFGC